MGSGAAYPRLINRATEVLVDRLDSLVLPSAAVAAARTTTRCASRGARSPTVAIMLRSSRTAAAVAVTLVTTSGSATSNGHEDHCSVGRRERDVCYSLRRGRPNRTAPSVAACCDVPCAHNVCRRALGRRSNGDLRQTSLKRANASDQSLRSVRRTRSLNWSSNRSGQELRCGLSTSR